jgi:hypothetical protein
MNTIPTVREDTHTKKHNREIIPLREEIVKIVHMLYAHI